LSILRLRPAPCGGAARRPPSPHRLRSRTFVQSRTQRRAYPWSPLPLPAAPNTPVASATAKGCD